VRRDNDTIPTLAELQRQRQGGWLWPHCQNIRCMHYAPMAIAPLVIRWGVDASSDRLRWQARVLEVRHEGRRVAGAELGRLSGGVGTVSESRPSRRVLLAPQPVGV
jgi:hypothetical protein